MGKDDTEEKWGWLDDRIETHNDWLLFRQAQERAAVELGVSVRRVQRLMEETYGEYHYSGILAMPWKRFLKDLKRTHRLKREAARYRLTQAWAASTISEEEALEEGLTIIDDPEELW